MVGEIQIRSSAKVLVYSYVLLAFWNFFNGFAPLKGGGFGEMFQRINAEELIQIFMFFVLSYYFMAKRSVYSLTNFKKNTAIVFVIGYITIFLYNLFSCSLGGLIVWTCRISTLFVFFLLRNDIQVKILDLFIKLLSILFFCSMVEYIVYVVNGHAFFVYQNLEYNERILNQTLFNIIPQVNLLPFGNFYRFQSLAIEPGNVGTLCGFLLFATSGRKDYRKQYLIFWAAGTLSFSLAFFVMAFVHLFAATTNNKNLLYIVLIVAGLVGIYISLKGTFDYMVVDRITSGHVDNRVHEGLQFAFEKSWRQGSLWMGNGIGNEAMSDGSAGIVVMLYQKGIIFTGILVLCYMISYLKILHARSKDIRFFGMVFFIVFWASFYQREFITNFDYILVYFTMPLIMFYNEKFINNKLNCISTT